MTLRVLIVEDEPDVAMMIVYGLRLMWPDSAVHVAGDGAEALRRFAEENADLVVLDVSMPRLDGFAVLERIRAMSSVPILMLTVRADTLDKVRALDLGADDYLTKPFDHLELLARLRALVRRANPAGAAEPAGTAEPTEHAPGALLVAGDIALDSANHEVRVRGEPVPLTSTEYRLLEELVRHAGRVLPHTHLLERIWGAEYVGEVHYLRVFVRRLRRKLGDDAARPHYIQTEWHTGYRFVPGPHAP